MLLAAVSWINPAGGAWELATNWSNGTGPGASDDAVIDVPAVTVTHSTGTHTVQSLTINNSFTLSGGTLIVTGNLVQQNANTFRMTGGTLRSATVVGGGGSVLVAAGGTLDGVTLGAAVGGVPTTATVQSSSNFAVIGGLTFANGSLLDLGHQMFVTGDQTLGGTGEIRYQGAFSAMYPSGQITFGSGLTIHRSDAGFSDIAISNGSSVTNRGTIRADKGGRIRVFSNLGSASFTNAVGGVLAAEGGELSLATDWWNNGQITANNSALNPNSTLNLGGNFTTDRIGSITRSGGTINLVGLLDNTGRILSLGAASGSWNLGVNGQLRGGSLVTSGGAVLTVNGGSLNGLTLGATIAGVPVPATVQGISGGGGGFFVSGGLNFANGSLLDLGTGMYLDGKQTLGGDGEIRFRGNSIITNYHETTFGPGLTIHRADASSSDISIVGGSITNRGTIRADVGGQIRILGNTSLVNAAGGVLSAVEGGTLSLLAPSWSNTGQIVVNNAKLNLGGSFTTAGLGAYTRTGGTINLVGLLDNTGNTLVLNDTTGSWNLASGGAEFRGGNLVTAGGAALVATTTNGSATLNGVTLGNTVDGIPVSATVFADSDSPGIFVTGGLTFTNGSLLDFDTGMTWVGDQTLGGDGEIRFRARSGGIRNFGHNTLGPGLTIRSEMGNGSIFMVGGSITNHGAIRVDAGQMSVVGNSGTLFTSEVEGVLAAAGGTFVIDANTTNNGTLSVTGGTLNFRGVSSNAGIFQITGGTLNLGGTWTNTGAFEVTGGTLNLSGNVTTPDLGVFSSARSGVINLTGTLDNTGRTLALDDTTGSLILRGGTISGGRVSTAGNVQLVAGTPSGSTLNGVTLAGQLTGLGISVTGGLTLEQGLIDVGQVSINGTQTLGGAGTVIFSTNNPFNDVRVSNNATLTIGPSVTIRGVTGFIGSTNASARILNQGTIAADGGGTFTVQGISNFASGTLTGGAWLVSGSSTLRLIGADISTNAADILVDGANARLFSDSVSKNALALLAANTAAGRLRLINGANLTIGGGTFNNQGSLTVGDGSTFVASTVTVEPTGTLAGQGTVQGNVVNNGQIRPGASPGNLSVIGNYSQGATGRLDIELGGATVGSQYDRLSISGSATLDGTLALSLIDGFGPATGQSFQVMTFADHTGTFSTVTGLSQGRFPLFSLAVNPANVELSALANGTDLAFDSYKSDAFPANAMPGQNISLTYTVRNLSQPAADGAWIDSVYLSRDGILDPTDVLLTRVEHIGGVAGLGSYTETATAPLPALIDANYRVIIVADSRGLVSDADRRNNSGVSAQAMSVSVPLLTLGTPLNGSISPGQDLYFRVLVTPGADVTLAADFAALPGADVSVRFAAVPDLTNQDDAAIAGQLQPRLVLSNTQGGTYYVRLHGREDAVGSIAFTLAASASGFEITAVSPLKGSNRAAVTSAIITLQGARFTAQTLVRLQQAGGVTRSAQAVEYISANKLVARIDLADLPIGAYAVVAEDAGQTTVALDSFTVNSSDGGGTGAWISAIGVCRVGCTIKLKLGYYNTSDNPSPAPLVEIRAKDVYPGPNENSGALTIADVPGFLPGNYSREFDPFKTYGTHPKNAGTSTFDLFLIEPSQTPTAWDTQQAGLRPSTIPPDAWDAIWSNLRPQLGETLSDYYQFLSTTKLKLRDATDELVNSIDRLFSFELQRANNMPAVPVAATAVDIAFPAPGLPLVFGRSFGATLTGRYHQGRLGRGWTDNFDFSISEHATSGTATLRQGGIVRYFGRRPDGSYESVAGDFGVLSKMNGVFQLRETTGEVMGFRPDGLLDFLQDANGNRLTAGYSRAQLTSLTHTSGAALTLAYNPQGRISQVTDPTGSVATYEYDASGEHLTRVTNTAGTTGYTYSADATGPRAHALASITFRDGAHQFFDYDSQGRLVRQQGDGGAETLRFAYDTTSYRVIDARDQATTFFYDDSFRIRKVRDPLGRLSYIEYDAANNPKIIGATGGGETRLNYDARGNPALVQNPIGEAQAFNYEPGHNRLVNWEDALGHETQFNHDTKGNLLNTTYADSSSEQFSYDSQGNVVGAVNRLGQSIRFTYNSRGQVTRKDLPDGTLVDYTYTARANLETVVDASGTTRLEYLELRNPDLLTKITYPTGRFLEYTYENGRRTRMVDQSGFATTYDYDAAGRLDVLRDGIGSVIVDYDYDALGRLARETRGNFTVTLYAYDNAGQLVEITHRAPDATVQSQFVYTYDHLGRRTSVTTLEGITSYGYDGAGRLNSAALPNGRLLTYAYDAAGNRTVASDNGAIRNYSVNNLNQYVAFGSTSQAFDAAGNLVSNSSPSGTVSYSYDAEGRLVSQIAPSGTWTYEYDALGNRFASTHDGVRTEYLVDPFGLGNVVGEYDGAGNLQAHYVHALGLTSRVGSAGSAAFYQFDAIGNTTQLTGAAGGVLNAYSYLPFGEALSASETVANPFEFVGQFGVMREGSGIDYMRNRWYAPAQGRFTQADPIGLAGGTNLYAYVGNNPISLIDPSGLGPTDEIITGVMSAEVELGLLAKDAARALAIQARDAAELARSTEAAAVVRAETAAWVNWVNSNKAAAGSGAATALRAGQYSLAAVQRAVLLAKVAKVARGGAYVAIAAGVASIIHSLGSGLYFATTDNELGCLPVVPNSWQVCNPRIQGLFGTNVQSLSVERVKLARDPNDIVGPAGFGAEAFVVPQATLPYLIRFQNLPAAEGPAAEVVVTHVLDANLDLDTFALDDFGFGDITVSVPAGRQVFSTRLDLRSPRGLFVDVAAGLDRATRTVTWRLQAIDPLTLDLPISPFVGFLPPDDAAHSGEGFVGYSIRPKAGLASGTEIRSVALIVFDTNDPIATNQVNPTDPSQGTDPSKEALVTIDSVWSTSSMTALPALQNATFTVKWTGDDDTGGSGLAGIDVFVSDNGGPYTPFHTNTLATSAAFTGQAGHTYRFYTLATDNVGHVEAVPALADTTISISTHPWQNALNALDVNNNGLVSPIDVLLIINHLNSQKSGNLPTLNVAGDPYIDTNADDFVSPIDALLVINYLNAGGSPGGEGEVATATASTGTGNNSPLRQERTLTVSLKDFRPNRQASSDRPVIATPPTHGRLLYDRSETIHPVTNNQIPLLKDAQIPKSTDTEAVDVVFAWFSKNWSPLPARSIRHQRTVGELSEDNLITILTEYPFVSVAE